MRALAAFALFAAAALARAAESQDVFVSGQGGYHTYRIPAVIRTARGTLLAFCEGRKDNARDAGRIDLVLRRSDDGGATWSATQVVWADGANTCGNPCPVVDASTGTIWLLASHNPGPAKESDIRSNAVRNGRTAWVLHSTDDGRTWSPATDITADVKLPDWRWYATGPGVGIQLQAGTHAGRLVIPCDYSTATNVGGSHVIYSDDHGAHWRIGGTVEPHMNECQVAELADGQGTLLLSMRSAVPQHQRAEAFSPDGGATWTAARYLPDLPDPVCQASILSAGDHRLLFSNPADAKKRRNLAVHASLDGGKTWPRELVLHAGPAAYSCLVALDATHAACLYENGDKNPYERITFARFEVAAIGR